MTIYRAASADALRIVPLDELTVAYHRPAGATHLLAEPAPQIIAALQERPDDVAGLLNRFELSQDQAAALAERIEELVAAGLVEAARDEAGSVGEAGSVAGA